MLFVISLLYCLLLFALFVVLFIVIGYLLATFEFIMFVCFGLPLFSCGCCLLIELLLVCWLIGF